MWAPSTATHCPDTEMDSRKWNKVVSLGAQTAQLFTMAKEFKEDYREEFAKEKLELELRAVQTTEGLITAAVTRVFAFSNIESHLLQFASVLW